MNTVETIRAALADARNRPWIGAGPSFGAPHPAYLNSVVEDVDHDDAATICRDTETGDARYIAACNPEAMTAVLAHIDAQAAEIERLRGWLEGDANCPCCDTNDVCVDGCTFAEDCPEDNEKMLEIRKLLRHNAEISGRSSDGLPC